MIRTDTFPRHRRADNEPAPDETVQRWFFDPRPAHHGPHRSREDVTPSCRGTHCSGKAAE